MTTKDSKNAQGTCDSCIHYIYDEDFLCYTCDLNMDEDEMISYTQNPYRKCPFYQFRDEYINVRKQI